MIWVNVIVSVIWADIIIRTVVFTQITARNSYLYNPEKPWNSTLSDHGDMINNNTIHIYFPRKLSVIRGGPLMIWGGLCGEFVLSFFSSATSRWTFFWECIPTTLEVAGPYRQLASWLIIYKMYLHHLIQHCTNCYFNTLQYLPTKEKRTLWVLQLIRSEFGTVIMGTSQVGRDLIRTPQTLVDTALATSPYSMTPGSQPGSTMAFYLPTLVKG